MFLTVGKLRISPLFLLLILFLLIWDTSSYTFIMFVSIFVHEAGHAAAILLCGGRITQIDVHIYGINIRTNGKLNSYASDIVIYLSGAFFNALFAAVAFFYMRCVVYNTQLLFFFSVNMAYAVFNLFPVKVLDGGKALHRMLELACEERHAYLVSDIISFVSLLILTAAGIYILYVTGYNISLVIVCSYLYSSMYVRNATPVRK